VICRRHFAAPRLARAIGTRNIDIDVDVRVDEPEIREDGVLEDDVLAQIEVSRDRVMCVNGRQ